jgi:hypothetical protein
MWYTPHGLQESRGFQHLNSTHANIKFTKDIEKMACYHFWKNGKQETKWNTRTYSVQKTNSNGLVSMCEVTPSHAVLTALINWAKTICDTQKSNI